KTCNGVPRVGRPRRRPSCRDRRGVAMVEFALVFPLLLLLVFGIIEFGQTLSAQQMIINGAREGARSAILPGATNAQVRQTIDNYMVSVGIKTGYIRQIK